MKFLALILSSLSFTFACAQHYSIFTEGDSLQLFQGKELLPVTVEEDYSYGIFYLTNSDGKQAAVYSYEFDKLEWFDQYIDPDQSDAANYLSDHQILLVKKKDKIGLLDIKDQVFLIEASLDSILFDHNNYCYEIFRDGKIAVVPADDISYTERLNQLTYYDAMYSVNEFFADAWYDENAFVCQSGNKFGVIRYSRENNKAKGKNFYTTELIPLTMDSIYFDYSQELFLAQKDGLFADFDCYRLDGKEAIEPRYESIYRDPYSYEIKRVASSEQMKTRFPSLTGMSVIPLPDATLYLLEGSDGKGIFWEEKNELILPMKFDQISIREREYVEVKKGNYYAYLPFQFEDYRFAGIDTRTFYVHDKPVTDDYFGYYGQSVNIFFDGDNLPISLCSDRRSECLGGTILADVLDPDDTPEQQLKALKKIYIEANFWENIYEAAYHDQPIEAHPIGQTKSVIVYAMGADESQIRKEFLLDKHPEVLQIALDAYDVYQNVHRFNGSYFNFFKGTEPLYYYLKGKKKQADWIQTSAEGFYAIYANGKGIVYDTMGKKVLKLKSNEVLTDAFKDRFIIEEFNYGDTLMHYSLRDKNNKEIHKLTLNNDNHAWLDNGVKAFRFVIDSNLSVYYYNIPMSFAGGANYLAESSLVQTTFMINPEALNDNVYHIDLYDLNFKRLDINKVTYDIHSDLLITTVNTARAEVHGIHNGYEWIIPNQYEEINYKPLYKEFEGVSPYFIVGNKGIYGLRDAEGKELLPEEYLHIELISESNKELKLGVVPIETSKLKTIVIELSK